MADIILDTNILADLLAQYYDSYFSRKSMFDSYRTLNNDLVRQINRIVGWHSERDWDETPLDVSPGLVIASTFAFVEIARKFQEISGDRFTLDQFAAFIDEPPEWFFISSVDKTILPHLAYLPAEVQLPNGDVKRIELADGIHLATAMGRDDYLIAATDERMRQVSFLSDKFV